MSGISEQFLWLLALILIYYLGAPLLIRFTQRYNAHPDFEELDWDTINKSNAQFLMTQTEALFEIGFDEPTLVHLPNAAVNLTTYLIMLVNRQTGDKAMIAVMFGHHVPIQARYVEFSTRFETGEVFDTHNIGELLPWPPAPGSTRTQVPMLRHPQELYELHKYVMSKHGASGEKVLYERGQALDYLARFVFFKPYEVRVEQGWLYFDRSQDCFRPTLTGAYLITWGLMQPFKALRQIALRRRARNILRAWKK
jgi:hypothetical protein